jgi:flavin reductase (DIM6/NTAB) family NADH-FMN oxidoreductase RutF
MSKIIGKILSPEIMNLINKTKITAVLATVSEDGWPNTAPMHLITAINEIKLRLSIGKMHDTYNNIKHNGRVMINILEKDDTAISIKGKARIVRDPMNGNKSMAMIEIDIVEIKSDTTPTLIVKEGIKTIHRSEKTQNFFNLMFTELSENM